MSRESTTPPALDLSEKGRKDGQPISLDRRLYMQFLAFGGCQDESVLIDCLENAGIDCVLYADANDAQGIGLLVWDEDPNFLIDTLRPLLKEHPFSTLTPKPEFTMLGRTYTIGYESDLEEVLLEKPRRKLLNPQNRWAVWYPLRREKSFGILPHEEQLKILGEHGTIGRSFGSAGLATDIRLMCHGLDKNDNDFVIGLLGHDLHPLSACVQAMRKTKQTAHHLESLGPFFVGKVIWQSEL